MRLTVRILGAEVLHLSTDPDVMVEDDEDMRGSVTSERVGTDEWHDPVVGFGRWYQDPDE